MKPKSLAAGLAVAGAILALAPVAAADYYIPPGNSGAVQYTQTLPTAGGNSGGPKDSSKPRDPKQVLGAKTAGALESAGPEGKHLAEVVAETSPTAAPTAAEPSKEGGHHGGGKKATGAGGKKPANKGRNENGTGTTTGSGPTSKGGAPTSAEAGSEPSGDGAVGQTVGQLTGSSAGGSIPLLPIAVVIALLWAISYAFNARRVRPN